MNYLKIQTDILKALCKGNVNKVLRRVAKSGDGNEIYLFCGDMASHFYILEKGKMLDFLIKIRYYTYIIFYVDEEKI